MDRRAWRAIEFLRDVGKHFSVNVMLDRDTIRRRLEGEGISYTEFSYMLLQANDYVELHRRYGCTLQIGGSDQWGNIIAGVRLVRQKLGRRGARADRSVGDRLPTARSSASRPAAATCGWTRR